MTLSDEAKLLLNDLSNGLNKLFVALGLEAQAVITDVTPALDSAASAVEAKAEAAAVTAIEGAVSTVAEDAIKKI